MDVTLSEDLGPAGARRALGCKSSRNLLGARAFDAGRRGAGSRGARYRLGATQDLAALDIDLAAITQQRQPPGVIHGAINRVKVRSANAIDWLESTQPFKIPESRLLFICFADIRRGAAGRTDCRSRMAGLQGFFAFA
jgi:hypothetical protein